jgi:para-aminobenzoate synthetase/4-amino-4-deoxychorismate lyase
MSSAPATQNTPVTTTLPRPDPAHGLFETLLILDGEPVELDAHLERLASSLATLFGITLPPDLASRAAGRARGLELGRMRIVVDPAGGVKSTVCAVDQADFFPAQERGAELRSVRWAGGLGRHKWADRRPLGETADGPVSLLLDRDDEVLEAGRANVFAVVGETLFTAAADGRILPGISRAATIEVAAEAGIEVREQELSRQELLAAEEVFLTGSVRGVEPVRSLDGVSLPTPTGEELGARIGESLLLRWRTGRLAATGS